MNTPFRQKALDRLSSPEQLDQALEVTSPRTWLAFASIAVLLIAVVIWSFVGRIPQKTDGVGILFPEGNLQEFAIQEIPATANGLVTNILVQPGDRVQTGDTVANLLPADAANQQRELDILRGELASLETEDQVLRRLEEQAAAELQRQTAIEQASLEAIIASKQENLRQLREIAASKEDLASRGVITREESIESNREVSATEADLNGDQHQLTQLQLTLERNQLDTERQQAQRAYQMEELRGQIASAEVRLQVASEVTAAFDGIVLQLTVTQGSNVVQGQKMALLERAADSPLSLNGYVSAITGKTITEGMDVEVMPTTAKREEYGFIRGTVRHVSEYPEDRATLATILENEDLVNLINERAEIPLQIEISLLNESRDGAEGRNNQDGQGSGRAYNWSTGSPPPQRLSIGTVANFSVITQYRRPIELVIPYIKERLGLD